VPLGVVAGYGDLTAVPIDSTRKCPVCGVAKPRGQFYLRKGRPGGYCKPCTKMKALEWTRRKREGVIGIEEARRLRERRRRFKEMALKDSCRCGSRTCRCCEGVFSVDDFYLVSGKRDSYCKRCRLVIDKKLSSKSPSARVTSLISAARTRSRKTGRDFDLTRDFLLGVWREQGGRCYYTGMEMTFDGSRSPSALSIDRVDSSLGYTCDNVVLCCRVINEMKSNLDVEELIRLSRMIVEIHEKRSQAHG
jgi:hypothetical protein